MNELIFNARFDIYPVWSSSPSLIKLKNFNILRGFETKSFKYRKNFKVPHCQKKLSKEIGGSKKFKFQVFSRLNN